MLLLLHTIMQLRVQQQQREGLSSLHFHGIRTRAVSLRDRNTTDTAIALLQELLTKIPSLY
jgi:hypothetical protein